MCLNVKKYARLSLAAVALSSAMAVPVVAGETVSTRGAATSAPAMRWDHKAEAAAWTNATMTALETHGQVLSTLVPADIAQWCPSYEKQDVSGRNAFWAGMLSTLAKHESTWRQAAVGGGGKWYGLVQILPGTARGYKCEAGTGAALKNGEMNLSCAVRIMATTVPRDGVVSKGMRGMAADWGPFHSRKKREDMRQWISTQDYCK